MNRKELRELRMSTDYAATAKKLLSDERLAELYDRYLTAYQKKVDAGIRLEGYSSKDEFAERWARVWAAGDKNMRKNPMRAIVNADQKISSYQAEAIAEQFTTKNVESFLEKNKARLSLEKQFHKAKDNEGKTYKGFRGVELTGEQEEALRKMAEMGKNKIRTQAFHEAYLKVKDVMKDYYKSISPEQKATGHAGNAGSWFYEIFYVD